MGNVQVCIYTHTNTQYTVCVCMYIQYNRPQGGGDALFLIATDIKTPRRR